MDFGNHHNQHHSNSLFISVFLAIGRFCVGMFATIVNGNEYLPSLPDLIHEAIMAGVFFFTSYGLGKILGYFIKKDGTN